MRLAGRITEIKRHNDCLNIHTSSYTQDYCRSSFCFLYGVVLGSRAQRALPDLSNVLKSAS